MSRARQETFDLTSHLPGREGWAFDVRLLQWGHMEQKSTMMPVHLPDFYPLPTSDELL